MNKRKNLSKPNKIQEDNTCMCQVHLRNDGEKALPCLGHGKSCSCTELLVAESLKKTVNEAAQGDGTGTTPPQVDTTKENV